MVRIKKHKGIDVLFLCSCFAMKKWSRANEDRHLARYFSQKWL
jgi:hypothetical protein